jgi:hypothetical protein
MGLDRTWAICSRPAPAQILTPRLFVGSHLHRLARWHDAFGRSISRTFATDDTNHQNQTPDCRDKLDQTKAAWYAPAMPHRCICRPAHAGSDLRTLDADGKTFGNELKRIGWQGDEAVARKCTRSLNCTAGMGRF